MPGHRDVSDSIGLLAASRLGGEHSVGGIGVAPGRGDRR